MLWHSMSSTQSERAKATILKLLSTVSQNSKLWSYTSFYTELRVCGTHLLVTKSTALCCGPQCTGLEMAVTQQLGLPRGMCTRLEKLMFIHGEGGGSGDLPLPRVYKQLTVIGGSSTETDNRDKHEEKNFFSDVATCMFLMFL